MLTPTPTTPEAKPNCLAPHFPIDDLIEVGIPGGNALTGNLIETSKIGVFVDDLLRKVVFIPWTAVEYISRVET